MTDPIRPSATKATHPTIISNSRMYIKGLYLAPTTPPAIAPAWDLCVTCSDDEKDDVDEDEGVGDVLVVDTLEEVLVVDGGVLMLTTVVGSGDAVVVIMAVVVVVAVAVVGDADAVDSGPKGKILQ